MLPHRTLHAACHTIHHDLVGDSALSTNASVLILRVVGAGNAPHHEETTAAPRILEAGTAAVDSACCANVVATEVGQTGKLIAQSASDRASLSGSSSHVAHLQQVSLVH